MSKRMDVVIMASVGTAIYVTTALTTPKADLVYDP